MRSSRTDQLDRQAVEALNRLYAQTPKNARRAGRQSEHSWKAVATGLGFNVGYIYSVANSRKRASNRLLHALGLPMRTAPAPVCPRHGVVHVSRRCPPDPAELVEGQPHPKRRNWKGLALLLAGIVANKHLTRIGRTPGADE